MTLEDYQKLTGITVSEADAPRMKAMIRRAEVKLEGLLGYSLSRQNKWTELGRVKVSGVAPYISLPVYAETPIVLDPPLDQEGNIQLFNFDELDTYIRINPAKEIYRVSVVRPINRDEFVTVHELEHAAPFLNEAGLVVAISRHESWYTWRWWAGLAWRDRKELMLAVDADYVNVCDPNRYPDLAYLLADMATYYADPDYSLLGNIRSESTDTHSYSRAPTGQTPESATPEGQPSAKKIIDKYAGASAFRKLVR
jgi:hypothetical protein